MTYNINFKIHIHAIIQSKKINKQTFIQIPITNHYYEIIQIDQTNHTEKRSIMLKHMIVRMSLIINIKIILKTIVNRFSNHIVQMYYNYGIAVNEQSKQQTVIKLVHNYILTY